MIHTRIAHIKNNLYELDVEYNSEPVKFEQDVSTGLGIWYYDSVQNRISQWELQEAAVVSRYCHTYKNNYHLLVASSKPLWRWWVHSNEVTWETAMLPSIKTYRKKRGQRLAVDII